MKRKKEKQFRSLFEYYGFTEKEAKEYPVVTSILKELTPERIKKENERIRKIKLPPEIQRWVREYEKVGDRPEYIWKWLYKMFQIVNLPGVSKSFQKSLLRDKVLITIFVALLDDAADKIKKEALLKELLRIPREEKFLKVQRFKKKEKKYLKLTLKIWKEIITHIKKYPRYKEFREIFYYDVNQVLNAINYSFLINKNPYLINKNEYWLYLPYNMVTMVYSIMDLMCSPKFNVKELRKTRQVLLQAQKMARIGNWLSTWERELREKDLTSGVIAYAIDSEIFTIDDLREKNKLKNLEKIKDLKIEKALLEEWERYYRSIENLGRYKKIINIKKFLFKLERFFTFHLLSKGNK